VKATLSSSSAARLVEQAERRRLVAEDREEQRQGGHRLAPGHQRDTFPRRLPRLRDHLDAVFEGVVAAPEGDRAAAVEQNLEGLTQ
jgi:hypothetical protein